MGLKHYGVLTFGVKELVAGRNGARGGGARPSFRRSRCGFARIPLRFDAPAVVSREFRPLLACSGLFWPLLGGPLRFPRTFVFVVPEIVGDFSKPPWPLLALLTVWGLRRHNGLGVKDLGHKVFGFCLHGLATRQFSDPEEP